MFTENITEKAQFVYENTSNQTVEVIGTICLVVFSTFGLFGLVLYLEHVIHSRINLWRLLVGFVVFLGILIWFIVELSIDVAYGMWGNQLQGLAVGSTVMVTLVLGLHAFCGVFLAVNHLCRKEKVEEPVRNRYAEVRWADSKTTDEEGDPIL
jgi:hypothetical protein